MIGMDYTYMDKHIYSQVLWQLVRRAQQLNLEHLHLGVTASQNKRKFGADIIQQVAFVQIQDNYNMSVINAIANTGEVDEQFKNAQKKVTIKRKEVIKKEKTVAQKIKIKK